jgi:hypothetical protein
MLSDAQREQNGLFGKKDVSQSLQWPSVKAAFPPSVVNRPSFNKEISLLILFHLLVHRFSQISRQPIPSRFSPVDKLPVDGRRRAFIAGAFNIKYPLISL